MPLDSLASAVLLFAASVAGWILARDQRAAARLYLRFAAILLAALAVCVGLNYIDARLGMAAALFLLPLISAALLVAMLARFARRLPDLAASLLFASMLAAGVAAALLGLTVLALAPLTLAGLLIGALALGRLSLLGALGAAALLAAAPAFLEQGVGSGILLFLAAAIVGLSRVSAGTIEQSSAGVRGVAISRLH